METNFSDWQDALAKLQACVTKDLEEIRKQKSEIQQIKADVFNRMAAGRYLRDDERIVISAPEIIIGNVDSRGMLWSNGGSIITIRGNQVDLDGVGDAGFVRTRAANITQKAVDPGLDGVEEVVCTQSTITSQAKHIVLQSNQAEGYFSQTPVQTGATGVRIHADEQLELDVTASVESRANLIGYELEALNEAKGDLKSDSSDKMDEVTSLISDLQDVLDAQDGLNDNEWNLRNSVVDIDELQDRFEELIPSLNRAVYECINVLSRLAETNRRISCLEKEQNTLNEKKSTFKDETTGTHLMMRAEQMSLESVDGDGNIRTNQEAAIRVQTRNLNIRTMQEDGSLIDDSHVNISTKNVSISTENPKVEESGVTGDYISDGSFVVSSKDVVFKAVDYSISDTETKETALSAGSSFSVRAENLHLSATDTEGNTTGHLTVMAENTSFLAGDKDGNTTGSVKINAKAMTIQSGDKDGNATGSLTVKTENVTMASADNSGKAIGQFCVNSKDVFVKSMDTDDKGADKNMASGGNMVLVAEKMFVGRTDKDNTSKELQISSDKTGIYGTTTAEVQQGEAKAVVQLDGGNVAIGGSKANFYGDNTVNGKTDFKGDVTAPKLTADNMEAKTSFKSKNISDGVAVPGTPSSAKISAKLKEADAPKPKVEKTEEDSDE